MNERQISATAVENRPLDGLLGAVQNSQQRFVLRYLSTHNGDAVPLSELVDALAQTAATGREAFTINLHHHHLPRLEDEGLLQYDLTTNVVQARELPPAVKQYLALAEG